MSVLEPAGERLHEEKKLCKETSEDDRQIGSGDAESLRHVREVLNHGAAPARTLKPFSNP